MHSSGEYDKIFSSFILEEHFIKNIKVENITYKSGKFATNNFILHLSMRAYNTLRILDNSAYNDT